MTRKRPCLLRRLRVPGHGVFVAIEGIDAEALSEALRAHERSRDTESCLKQTRDRLVARVSLRLSRDGKRTEAVVKQCRTSWRWRVAQRFGWPSRFAREAAKTYRLSELGVLVPEFLAASRHGSRGSEFLVTRWLEGGVSLRDLLWHGPNALEGPEEVAALLTRVGTWLCGLHDRGIWQRDMKPDNVIVRREEGSPPRLYLVDITDLRFLSSPVDTSRRIRNIGQLLDLPLRFDKVARAPLLEAYLGQAAGECADWETSVTEVVEARRARRTRLFGLTYVDEEAARDTGTDAG